MDGDSAEYITAIRQLKLDIAFVAGTGKWPSCGTAHLWSERVFVALPNDHDLAEKDEIEWHDLVDQPVIVGRKSDDLAIYNHIVRHLANRGSHLQIQWQMVGQDNLLPMVAIFRSLMLTNEARTGNKFPGIAYRPMVTELMPFSAVWSLQNDNPALQRLLNIAIALNRNGSIDVEASRLTHCAV